MKKSEIVVGGVYLAKISGKIVPVRVDAIRDSDLGQTQPRLSYVSGGRRDRRVILYDVTNLTTRRTTTFRSAAKFRKPAPAQNPPIDPENCQDNYPISVLNGYR